ACSNRRYCEEAEADVVVVVARPAPVPVRRRAEYAAVVPTPAPVHPAQALLGGGPLPDVTMQVVDTKRVRQIQPHLAGTLKIGTLGSGACRVVAIEIGLGR